MRKFAVLQPTFQADGQMCAEGDGDLCLRMQLQGAAQRGGLVAKRLIYLPILVEENECSCDH